MRLADMLEACPYVWEYGHVLPDPEATTVKHPLTPREWANIVAYHTFRMHEISTLEATAP